MMIAITFIIAFVLGGLCSATAVYTYELKILQEFGRRVAEVEKGYADMLAAENEHAEKKRKGGN